MGFGIVAARAERLLFAEEARASVVWVVMGGPSLSLGRGVS